MSPPVNHPANHQAMASEAHDLVVNLMADFVRRRGEEGIVDAGDAVNAFLCGAQSALIQALWELRRDGCGIAELRACAIAMVDTYVAQLARIDLGAAGGALQ